MTDKKRLVYGVGINDADYAVTKWETTCVNGVQKRKLVWYCPYHRAWTSMLQRCYSLNYQERNPTYKGCSVSEEWLTFSNFKRLDGEQDFEGQAAWIRICYLKGNKVYSAESFMCLCITFC